MFLNLQLLELDELGPAALQIQTSTGLVDSAIVARTDAQRSEAERVDRLEGLSSALVARIRSYLKQRLHVSGTRDDPFDNNNLSVDGRRNTSSLKKIKLNCRTLLNYMIPMFKTY